MRKNIHYFIDYLYQNKKGPVWGYGKEIEYRLEKIISIFP
jgi:hypothetical protein